MQDKSSPLSLFHKLSSQAPAKQSPMDLYASSSQQVQSLPAMKKVNVYHFVGSSPPECANNG